MGKSFKIITLGCKVNQYESAHMEERLTEAGWSRVSQEGRAEVAIVNTCIVTQKAAYQSRQAIRKCIRENPDGITAAVGCYGQVFPEELAGIKGLDLIGGNADKGRLPQVLLKAEDQGLPHRITTPFRPAEPFECLPIKGFPGRTRAFLKIQDGCESFCSYCIVPLARGPSRSLEPDRVLTQLERLVGEGFKEVVLTGIHLGKYGADLDPVSTLTALLERIGREGWPLRIRLSSLEPNEIHSDLIDMVGSQDWLCRHFHIPLQSGDSGILKGMNRHYRARDFAALVAQIHGRIPYAAIGVDAMAGFPGEENRAFQRTYDLIRDLPVSYLHVFPYSPRKGTAAARFSDRVPERLIKERAAALRDLGRQKRAAFYRACLGETFRVIAEGWQPDPGAGQGGTAKGLSDNYLPVRFPAPGPIKNRMVLVRLERVDQGGLFGRITEPLP